MSPCLAPLGFESPLSKPRVRSPSPQPPQSFFVPAIVKPTAPPSLGESKCAPSLLPAP